MSVLRNLLRKFANWMERRWGGIIVMDGTCYKTSRGPIFSDNFKIKDYRSYFIQFNDDVPVKELLDKLTDLPFDCQIRGSNEKYWE